MSHLQCRISITYDKRHLIANFEVLLLFSPKDVDTSTNWKYTLEVDVTTSFAREEDNVKPICSFFFCNF